MGALPGREFPRPALPIGTPPPNPQVAPLPATKVRSQHKSTSKHKVLARRSYPSFRWAATGSKHSYSVAFVVELGNHSVYLAETGVRQLEYRVSVRFSGH